MKQFIVLAAVLPILLVFVAQFTLSGMRGLRLNAAEDVVRAFCIETSYYNGGGLAEVEALRHRLAQIFHTDPADIQIEFSQVDETHIDWNISFPIGEIMAGARLMGLSPAENQGRARMSGTIVIVPKPKPQAPNQTDEVDEAEKIDEPTPYPDTDREIE